MWLRLDGLSLDDISRHSALCHTLTRFGIGTETGRALPATAVLDWSRVEHCSAEGIAFFPVIVRHLVAAGVSVVACRPAVGAIDAVLEHSGVRAACATIPWVPCPNVRTIAVESLASAAIFDIDANETVEIFCDELSAALRCLDVPRATAQAVMGTTQEVLHNVLSHAVAPHAAATALLFPRRRPTVLQIGIADDGIGISNSVLRQTRHQWLQWFHDAGVTETVLHQALSGRDATPESGTGGGMARVVQRLLKRTTATVMLRSGAAFIVLQSSAPDRFVKTALTYGAGTQFRLELRLA